MTGPWDLTQITGHLSLGSLCDFIDMLRTRSGTGVQVPGTAVSLDRGRQTAPLALHANVGACAPVLSTVYANGGGHNTTMWHVIEALVLDWLSTWLGQPYPVAVIASTPFGRR